jgi:hypothetical protein
MKISESGLLICTKRRRIRNNDNVRELAAKEKKRCKLESKITSGMAGHGARVWKKHQTILRYGYWTTDGYWTTYYKL